MKYQVFLTKSIHYGLILPRVTKLNRTRFRSLEWFLIRIERILTLNKLIDLILIETHRLKTVT